MTRSQCLRFSSELDLARLRSERRERFQRGQVSVPAPASAAKPNKYGNRKTNGYDSKREAVRATALHLMERAGEIAKLREQVPFLLIPAQKDASGKVIERPCSFIADFTYEENGTLVVEDVKSEPTKTPEYRIKRKLMLLVHGIRIRETRRE